MKQTWAKGVYDWVGKLILWELCKKLKFNHANKYSTHKPKSVKEKEMHKILWDFVMKTDHNISARRPGLVIITKKREIAV